MYALRQHTLAVVTLAAGVAAAGAFVYGATARAQGPQAREVAIKGDQFAFSPSQIDVQKDDLVKITFTAVDMPHSFTIDGYRIAKRAGAGQSVVFEFRADRDGEHVFYCNLAQDDRCRQMKGKLVVR
jgi:heme/copper-type cytochrome/quinol oxidase subunit 2